MSDDSLFEQAVDAMEDIAGKAIEVLIWMGTLDVKAEDGRADPPKVVLAGKEVKLKAVHAPAKGATYKWTTSSKAITLDGAATDTVTVKAGPKPSKVADAEEISLSFTPPGGKKAFPPLKVKLTVFTIEIKAEDGKADAPKAVMVNESVKLKAVLKPAVGGAWKWTVPAGGKVSLAGDTTDTVTVKGAPQPSTAVDAEKLQVVFTPTGGAALPAIPWPMTVILAEIKADVPVAVVKKPHVDGARTKVTLKVTPGFSGTGTLKTSSDRIVFWTKQKDGDKIKLNDKANVFDGAKLGGAGLELFAEGTKPSAAEDDVTVTLTLKGVAGAKPIEVKFTSVDVSVVIHKSRTAAEVKGGKDAQPMPEPPEKAPDAKKAKDKFYRGRFVQKQDPGNNAGRALVIVKKTPHTIALRLKLTPSGGVKAMDAEAAGTGSEVTGLIDNAKVTKDGLRLFAEGTATSGALRAALFKLGLDTVTDEADTVSLTVVEFTKIKATIKPTPQNTPANAAAAGLALPANHTFESTSLAEDFVNNKPLVLIRNAQPDTALEVTVAPAGVPLVWKAIRDAADHASIGGEKKVPQVTEDAADEKKANLDANERGSFHVRVFADVNGSEKFEDKEPSIALNLVLVDAIFKVDRSQARPGNLTQSFVGAAADDPRIKHGTAGAGIANGGMSMDCDVDVIGGGADGKTGLDKVFGGLCNNLLGAQIRGTYVDPGPPVANHLWINVYVSNTAAATGVAAGTEFQPGDAAPVPLAFKMLDSARPTPGIGGETACMNASTVSSKVALATGVGERWTIQCRDSPSRTFSRMHPYFPAAQITHIQYHQQFQANFVLWTNIATPSNSGATGDPADRVYCAVRKVPWKIKGDWDVRYPAAGPPAFANQVYSLTSPNGDRKTVKPVDRAQDHAIEVRAPSGIKTLIGGKPVIGWDGRA